MKRMCLNRFELFMNVFVERKVCNMNQKEILIIDDDEDLSMIISDMLENYGYGVTCAFDSETAFELLSDNVFHLILLDINLPDTTGFELCKELRRVSNVPVIFASARTSETDRITGFDIDQLVKVKP